ncbi:hypothetical protein Droror1_Dr00008783 [Drosera rotundifolia]
MESPLHHCRNIEINGLLVGAPVAISRRPIRATPTAIVFHLLSLYFENDRFLLLSNAASPPYLILRNLKLSLKFGRRFEAAIQVKTKLIQETSKSRVDSHPNISDFCIPVKTHNRSEHKFE